MVVIVVVGVVLIATLCAHLLATRRPGDDALLRHERALAALRNVAEHPRPLTVSARGEDATLPDEHIRILREPPEGATARRKRARSSTAAARRTAASRTAARKRAKDVERPTIASLPTRPQHRRDESPDESSAPPPLVMPVGGREIRADEFPDESPDESSAPAELQVRRVEDRPGESLDESSTPIPLEVVAGDNGVDESSDESSTRVGIPIVGVFGGEFVLGEGPPEPVPSAGPQPEPVRLTDHPRSPALTRPRVLAVAAAAVVTIGVSIGAALAISPHHAGSRPTHPPALASPAPPPPLTAAAPLTVTTPTTAPGVRLLASATGDGTVPIATPFALNLVATGPCWVGVTTAGGQTVFQGTLRAGDSRAIAGAGELVVRLGNSPVIHLTVNGTQLDLAGVGRTANVKFVPNA